MSSVTSLFDLSGRRVLISGAAGGIGSAAARLFVQHGAEVVLIDRVSENDIKGRVGPDVARLAEFHSLDTSDRQAVEQMVKDVGPVYALIDTAAVCPADDWMAPDWDEALEMVVEANIKGPINLCRAVFPGMLEREAGRIVLCGSVAGWMGGIRSGPHYAFSKGGIHSFVRWLARQGAPHNVLVNGLAPGPVETAMTAGRGYTPELYPLKRMAKPEEIASAAIYLCAASGGYTTGAILDINGATHFH